MDCVIAYDKDLQEKSMRIVLTLLVRDEIDVIEGMLDYHLAHGVDHIIITDNGSVDGTYEICNEYARRNKVKLMEEPPSDFSQHRWVSRMANIAHDKFAADWVIHADADEMFVPAYPYDNLKDALKSTPSNVSVLKIPRHDFVPFNRVMNKSPHIEMVYRKSTSLNLQGAPLPPKVIHRGAKGVKISQGNHEVTGGGLGEPYTCDELSVYHYPIRSCEQFHNKVSNGGSGYNQNTELDPGIGFHKRYWYNLLLENKLTDVYYKEHFLTPEQVQQSLLKRDLVEDYCVADYFQSQYLVKLRQLKEFFTEDDVVVHSPIWSMFHKA